ncbi:hypothetical protein B7463_g12244, partial [Scytalidium lignicola]
MARTCSVITKSDANPLKDTIEWYFNNQDDPNDQATITTTTHIFKVKINTLCTAIQRRLTPVKELKQPMRQSPFLKPHQVEALLSHIKTQAYNGNLLNKAMFLKAATYLYGDNTKPSLQ